MRYKVNIFVYLFHLKTRNMGTKKQFVLDTNVILHDYKCIYNFEENDIYLPLVVFEELDRFKRERPSQFQCSSIYSRTGRFDG